MNIALFVCAATAAAFAVASYKQRLWWCLAANTLTAAGFVVWFYEFSARKRRSDMNIPYARVCVRCRYFHRLRSKPSNHYTLYISDAFSPSMTRR